MGKIGPILPPPFFLPPTEFCYAVYVEETSGRGKEKMEEKEEETSVADAVLGAVPNVPRSPPPHQICMHSGAAD